MNIHRIALCYVFLAALCDVNTGFVFDTPVHEEAEGENITVGCSFTWAGNNKKFFCKGECKNENILIETDKDKDQNGRYSIEDKRTGLFFVTITQLTKSDSGSYRCGVDRLLTHSYKEFDITVTDGSSTPSSPLSTTQQSEPPAAQDSTHSASNIPMETEYAAVTEGDRVYEEIREKDRPTVYSYARYAAGAGDAADPDCAAAGSAENKAEDDSDDVSYSKVYFSNGLSDASSNSAPGGNADDVVYSVARLPNAETHSETSPVPLYSTITLPGH
ncbi:CMRF35-like molecule 9 isoform X5 [Centroberyx affinis]|uniref:CMRF35-like molecule 9 isoform X5 n=1 Tax=Centroberyx affinis TaxID=166261 RepID=UPI003A5BC812